jgi:hypothetical protein
MLVSRILLMAAGAAALFGAAPASAQFFIKPANLAGERVTGAEAGMVGQDLPGATPEEYRAALVWNLRAALNVAALQCQFEPTLLTLPNYNAIIRDHGAELRNSYLALEKYFIRTKGANKKAGQTALDQFGTRVYAGFSTVSGQLSFCQTAASVSNQAVFARRGQFGDVAQLRMREMRASLAAWGEQAFPRNVNRRLSNLERVPPFGDENCWNKGAYVVKKCGPLPPGWGTLTTD